MLDRAGGEMTDTTVPAKTPAKHLQTIICHIVLLMPNRAVATAMPASEETSIGFLPNLSAALPHIIITNICVSENSDSLIRDQRIHTEAD